jgi:hypothetical protein
MRAAILFLILLGGTLAGPSGQAQSRNPRPAPELVVQQTDSAVRIDGALTETVWQRARVANHFTLNYPNDTAQARNQTEIRITYDDQFLYIGAVCYDDMTKPFVASSLRRDFAWDFNDNLSIYLNPSSDRVNGFAFYLTPLGVEREAMIYNGEEIAPEWDNKWYSAVKVYADRWVGEMAIPFKSIRYRGQDGAWKMNFARHDLKNNQRSSWVPVPIAYNIASLAFTSDVRFEKPLPHPGVNVALIPYLTGRTGRNFAEGKAAEWKANAGFDAKVAVTPSLNLDLTVNPDFSQVEVDQQITNLERFELFFPERRQFFLENSDLFNSYGFETVRPFFSRRIGIGRDTITKQIVQNPILYGARLSGKLNKDWRIGLLNMQTARDRDAGIAGQNYTVAALQRQVFGRSTLGALLINRQQFGGEAARGYTRLAGLDYNLQTADNRWQGKFFYHHAAQPGRIGGNNTFGSNLRYQVRKLEAEWLQEYVGANYQINDIGYVPETTRNGYWRFRSAAFYRFYPKTSKRLVSHGFGFELNTVANLDGRFTDRELDVFYNFTFLNTSSLMVGVYNYYNYLLFPFDPTNAGGLELPEGTGYHVQGTWWELQSDTRKRLNGFVGGWTGGYYNGRMFTANPQLNYRFQPYGSIGIAAEYSRITLPEPFRSTEFWLVGPRLDISFSRKLFLTTFLQYNEQADNVNLNGRFQWRFRPVSDLFIVYSENYFPGNLDVKNRALVLKLSYWLSL